MGASCRPGESAPRLLMRPEGDGETEATDKDFTLKVWSTDPAPPAALGEAGGAERVGQQHRTGK